MKKLITVFCMISTFPALAGTFHTDDGFSITLPDDWIQIPKQVMDERIQELSEISPDFQNVVCDYGFQHASHDTWFSLPYIIVQVQNIGRIPSGKLSQFKRFDDVTERVSNKFKHSFFDQVSDVSLNEPIYDSENNILWMFSSIDFEDGETMKGISGVKLTEKGTIQLTGYSSAATYDAYKEFFHDTFQNVSIDESIRYAPLLTDTLPVLNGIDWEDVLVKFIEGIFIFGTISIVTIISKRKKKKGNKPKREELTPDQF